MNLGGASAGDHALRVSGYSADLPLCLALISAGLEIPLAPVVSTGHLASTAGDLAIVRDLPAKFEAASEEPSIHCMIVPSLDASLDKLSPAESENIKAALARARGRLRVIEASHVGQVLPVVFAEEDVILASLKEGFYDREFLADLPQGISRFLRHLTANHELRFWKCLETQLLHGANQTARRLIEARARLEHGRSHYPEDFGRMLWERVIALPPLLRRARDLFPLLDIPTCLELGRHAPPHCWEDVPILIDATCGRHLEPPPAITAANRGEPSSEITSRLNLIIEQLSDDLLTQKITLPIDTARASFPLPYNTVGSEEEFLDILGSYFLHHTRHGQYGMRATDKEAATVEATALVSQIYQYEGGLKGALALARDGRQGGVGGILSKMTEQFMGIEREKYINLITKESYEVHPFDERLALTAALLDRLASLSPGIGAEEPERYVENFTQLLRRYVDARDTVSRLIRRQF